MTYISSIPFQSLSVELFHGIVFPLTLLLRGRASNLGADTAKLKKSLLKLIRRRQSARAARLAALNLLDAALVTSAQRARDLHCHVTTHATRHVT